MQVGELLLPLPPLPIITFPPLLHLTMEGEGEVGEELCLVLWKAFFSKEEEEGWEGLVAHHQLQVHFM